MSTTFVSYAALAAAILCEISGTTFLQKSEQFTRPGFTAAMALFYAGAFFFLTQALRFMPLAVAYAIWSGAGVVLATLVGTVVFGQSMDLPGLLGIGLIVVGVVVLQAWSSAARL